jgi:hypothetical protein
MKTIKQIPIKILKAQIKASKELLDYYEGKIGGSLECPLCDAIHKFKFSCAADYFCPWNFIENSDCGKASDKICHTTNSTYLRDSKNPFWLKFRIPMLKRWIRLMRQEIKRRQKG